MARIQVQTSRTVESRALPTPYRSDSPYDAGPEIERLTQRVGELGKQVANYAGGQIAKAKQAGDNLKVTDSMTELQRGGTDEFYGTQNPTSQQAADAAFEGRDSKQGYLSLKGTKAADEGGPLFQRLKQRREDLLGGLQNDEQKLLFKQQSEHLLTQWYAQIESHTAREIEQAKVDSIKNAEAEAVRAAALNPGDDAGAVASIARVVVMQDNIASSTGDAFARAQVVQANVTRARLDALLAQPGGFVAAERVLNANKGALGGFADDYEKRIAAAKVGGLASVEAERILVAADGARRSATSDAAFAMPDQAVAEQLLAKLPPDMQKVAAPIVASRIAMVTAARKKERDAFVDKATSIYNDNPAVFFSSDIARRLNKVDPDKFRTLRNEATTRARLAGDDSARARREQAELDAIALNEFKALSPEEQADANIDTFVAGRTVSPKGKSALGPVQAHARLVVQKGLQVEMGQFVNEYSAAAFDSRPTGNSKAARAAQSLFDKKVKADARGAYAELMEAHPEAKPTREELAKKMNTLLTELPVNPNNPESVRRSNEALQRFVRPAAIIPAEERTKIEAALKKRGRAVTEEAVQQLFHQVHGG